MELHLKQNDLGIWQRINADDEAIRHEIFVKGDYDPVLKMDLGISPQILDLGSHIGLSVRWFFNHYPEAYVVAIEPDESSFNVLALNGTTCDHLDICHAFVSATEGFASVLREGQEPHGYRKGPQQTDPESGVLCCTIPQVMDFYDLDKIDLLKCDIEGSEVELFSDCKEWISSVRYALIEVHKCWYGYGWDLPDLYAALTAQDVKFEVLEEKHGHLAFIKFN